jgi:hypothetical protein
MATQSWLSDWLVNIDQSAAWALLLLAVAVIVLVIILVWRRKRRPALDGSISHGANDASRIAFDPQWLSPGEQAPYPFTDDWAPSRDATSKADATPKAGEAAINDRTIGWRPLYPYIKHQRFTKWTQNDLTSFVDEESCPLAIKLFISHRWKTPDDPDPDNKSLPTIVEYLSRVYMAANGYLDANSHLVKELVIGDNLRDAFHERELHYCACKSIGWLDLKSLLGPDDLFYQRVGDTHRRRAFYRLLKHVRVWYDYASLPQARATFEEKAVFDSALNKLAGIVNQSDVLALWGLESINRAWCIFEVLAGKKVYFCAPAQAQFDSTQKAMLEAAGYPDLAEYRGRQSPSILIHVKSFRSSVAGLNEREIEAYLREHRVECSKDEDFSRIARLIHQYLQEYDTASNWST